MDMFLLSFIKLSVHFWCWSRLIENAVSCCNLINSFFQPCALQRRNFKEILKEFNQCWHWVSGYVLITEEKDWHLAWVRGMVYPVSVKIFPSTHLLSEHCIPIFSVVFIEVLLFYWLVLSLRCPEIEHRNGHVEWVPHTAYHSICHEHLIFFLTEWIVCFHDPNLIIIVGFTHESVVLQLEM